MFRIIVILWGLSSTFGNIFKIFINKVLVSLFQRQADCTCRKYSSSKVLSEIVLTGHWWYELDILICFLANVLGASFLIDLFD